MNWIDIGIIALILYQGAIGFRHGVLRGVLDLAGLVVALVIATTQAQWGAGLIRDVLSVPPPVARWLSFLVCLGVLTFVLRGMISLMSRFIRRTRQTWSDRIGGLFIGSMRGLITASLFLVLFTLMPLPSGLAAQIDQSPLAPSTLVIVPSLYDFLAASILPWSRPFYEQLNASLTAPSAATAETTRLTMQQHQLGRFFNLLFSDPKKGKD